MVKQSQSKASKVSKISKISKISKNPTVGSFGDYGHYGDYSAISFAMAEFTFDGLTGLFNDCLDYETQRLNDSNPEESQ